MPWFELGQLTPPHGTVGVRFDRAKPELEPYLRAFVS